MPILVLIGKRASGKTTIANKIVEKLSFTHIEMSSLLKELRVSYNKEDLRLREFVEFLRQADKKELAVSMLADEIKKIDKVIVTGIRHPDELSYLTTNCAGNQIYTIFIKLNFFKRLGRVLKRNNRNTIFEFIVEEYYSWKWKNRDIMNMCDYIFSNFSSNKTFDDIDSKILCQ